MKTTLNKIRENHPCADGWGKILKHLGKTKADDESLALTEILESNGMDDAIWCLCAVDNSERDSRLFAVWCARQVQHLMEDHRSINVLDIAERFANGEATAEDMAAAWAAAGSVAWSAAGSAAGAAAWAAAGSAAWAAAGAAARGAAWAAARDAAGAAAWVAAGAAVNRAAYGRSVGFLMTGASIG